jgi:hypothetical protein
MVYNGISPTIKSFIMTQEEFQAGVLKRLDKIDIELDRIRVEIKAYWDAAKLMIALAFGVIGATAITLIVQAFIHRSGLA